MTWQGKVIAVARAPKHNFTKKLVPAVRLAAGVGVDGDAHAGKHVKHRSRVKRNAAEPNLRQVHLIPAELFEELAGEGFVVAPGDLGENVTTRGINLLRLPRGTRLHLGSEACVEVTGLRNPCFQLDEFQPGLLKAMVGREPDGTLLLKAGIMAIVIAGGQVKPGDAIGIELPATPHEKLERV